jgi:hypothetical protein
MKKITYGILVVLIVFLFICVSKVNAEEECVGTKKCFTSKVWVKVESCRLLINLKLNANCKLVTDTELTGHWEGTGWKRHWIIDTKWSGHYEEFKDVEDCTCVALTPTPLPVVETPCTQNCGNPPTFQGSTTEAFNPTCGGIFPNIPLLQRAVRINPTTINLGWWPVWNASKYSLIYGYEGESLMHGIVSIDRNVTGLNVGSLRPNTKTQFQLISWLGECVSRSGILLSN